MLLHLPDTDTANNALIVELRAAREAVADAYVEFNNDSGTNAVEDALEALTAVEDKFWAALSFWDVDGQRPGEKVVL